MKKEGTGRDLTGLLLLCALFLVIALFGGRAEGFENGQKEEEGKTLSPYFYVKSTVDGTEGFPLKSTSADVDISGPIANVTVTQEYQNNGQSAIEAVYVFPASTRAAVHAMKMTIGDRVKTAKIKKKNEARAEYEQAKSEGKSASLLEEERPNVFKMNVANIMPGDTVKVELSYTEYLSPTESVYEFVYPTVVGPRYSNQPAENAPERDKWVSSPYMLADKPPTYTFDIKAAIRSAIPVKDVASPSHKVDIGYESSDTVIVKLSPEEAFGGARDYILRYRLKDMQIQSGLMLYKGGGTDEENFFLLAMEPPQSVDSAQMPPREYIFVLDVSGSMNGFPLEISKALMKSLLQALRPEDTFNVLLFAAGSQMLWPVSQPYTEASLSNALYLIDRQRGGGGTELLSALKRALSIPAKKSTSRTIVVLTDGYVTVENEVFKLVRENLGRANLFCFGIGSSVNRHLVELMARAGLGEPFVVTSRAEAPESAARFVKYIGEPVLSGIKAQFSGFDAYDIEPGGIPDMLAQRPIVISGRWRGPKEGSITLKGYQAGKLYENTIDVSKVTPSADNSALKYLWVRGRIETLDDLNRLGYDSELEREITSLGLTYNLLTQYTSFVAVDDVVRNPGGAPVKVKQPLLLPHGVSNNAVGQVPGVPEPETWAMLGILGLILAASIFKSKRLPSFFTGS